MRVKNNCDLSSCYLCSNCMPAWIPAVAGNREVRHYIKGEILFSEGDTLAGMFFVYDGLVKVHKKWGTDKELIVRFAKKGDILGHRGLGEDNRYPVSATALEATSICFIPLGFFNDTLIVNTHFTLGLLHFFASELKLSEQKMRNLAHMPVKGRIAHALLLLKEKFGTNESGVLNIELSRQDFASYVGTVYETAFRILNEMVEENAIRLNKKEIILVDTDRLNAYCKSET